MITFTQLEWRNQRTHPKFRTMDCDKCYVEHGPMLEALDDYDWRNAFDYFKNYTREDVAEILGLAVGENDGPEWLLLAKMRDGKFGGLRAGCDYTGWD